MKNWLKKCGNTRPCLITSGAFLFRNPPSSHMCDICDLFSNLLMLVLFIYDTPWAILTSAWALVLPCF